MNSPFQNSALPGSIAPTKLWKDRRVIVGGSVGVSLLLIVILILAGRSGTDASAATSAVRPAAAEEHVGKDSPASKETYPIPPEAVAVEAARTTPVLSNGSAAAPSAYEGVDAGKPGSQRGKPARDRFAARRVASTPRAPSTASRGSGAASANVRPALSSASPGGSAVSTVRRPAEPAMSPDSLAAEPKKRVPLVDDQPRVHILE